MDAERTRKGESGLNSRGAEGVTRAGQHCRPLCPPRRDRQEIVGTGGQVGADQFARAELRGLACAVVQLSRVLYAVLVFRRSRNT